jgi:OmcA/MtrC family decaheme c-type cytochrome
MTINFSSSDPAVVPELLVSFYGWDTKNFIVGSHERDANAACSGFRPGCKMEYVPETSGGSANPLFTEDAASVPGAWVVTLDMSALQLTKTALLPAMIADGTITKAEISITPELEVGGQDVVLAAVSETFDLTGNMIIADYFAGANAIVDVDKCNVCHDSLASTFHDGSGRGGDGIQVCKACHTTTFPGSHLEQASRAIDSYVHAIHAFQPFDLDDVAAADDPVFDARNELHIGHTFPNFTVRNCEACHNPGTYNVPDQAQSMPGVLSASWDIADRNIGTVPEYVTGPASRACGGCHRADLINPDLAGDLASFNAHTEAFGTLEENDGEDMVLFGIIDKIMSMF